MCMHAVWELGKDRNSMCTFKNSQLEMYGNFFVTIISKIKMRNI